MKYTKEDIYDGLEFTAGGNSYRIVEIKGNDCKLAYGTDGPLINSNRTLDEMIKYFNDGTWTPTQPKAPTYEVF